MRSFSKKLAFVLAAAMVVTGFAPAAQAKAADEMAINKSSQILYLNEGINHKGAEGVPAGKGNVSVYDFSVKNKPSDWKTAYSFAWSSSNEDVVTVKAGGVATAVGVGKATVYCKVTEKATKKVTTLKTAVEVKENAAKVAIKNAADWDGTTVEVNGVVDLDRIMYNAAGKSTTKRGTLVTDYTRWVAEPSKGVEINQSNGKFTFTEEAEAGDYTLYCETYQSSKYTKTTATSDKVVVTFVGADTFEVKQTASNGFNLLFNKAADVKIADVTVNKIIAVGTSTSKIPMVVSGVTMSTDKKTASVSLFSNFENGATYEISVKGYDDVATLVPSIGAPVSMTISSKSNLQGGVAVYVGDTGAELTYKLFDAQGNDVTNTATGYVVFSAADVATSDYFVDNGYVIINVAGTQVAVNAVYHTGEYDNNANEKTISATGYFVGVNATPNTIASVNIAVQYWGSTLSKVPVNLGTANLVVKIKTTKNGDYEQQYTNGAYIDNLTTNGVTPFVRYRSTNPDVLDVNGDNVALFTQGTSAILVDLVTLNADGSENVNTIAASYVTVAEGSKVSNIVVGNGASVVAGTVDGFDQSEISITVADQYGFTWGAANWNDSVVVDGQTVAAAFDKVAFADGTVISQGTRGAIWLSPRRGATGWADKVVVDGSMMLDEMVAAGYMTIDAAGNWLVNGRNVTTITKRVVVTATANDPAKNVLSFTFNVTLKKAVGTESLSVEASGTTSGNIARYNTPYDGNTSTEDEKKVEFKVFTKQNGIKTGQLDLEGVKPSNNVVPAGVSAGALFYTVTRNGADITDLTGAVSLNAEKNALTVEYSTYVWDAAAGAPSNNICYETWSATQNKNREIGAGTYVFTVYQVKENATTGNLYFAYVGASSTSVTCDAGNYTYAKRLAESVDSADEAALRACFEVLDRDGNKTTNDYSVEYTEAGSYIHVKSITFYEALGTTGKFVPYKVNIGVSLKKNY
ncbi:MAG: hypothetical protein PUC73_04040 [Lachnospiraceae bacterium]|nr:hypothetical protein [Lachnospiraceae bacterium]